MGPAVTTFTKTSPKNKKARKVSRCAHAIFYGQIIPYQVSQIKDNIQVRVSSRTILYILSAAGSENQKEGGNE
jgi:hypothetical protein